MTRTSRRAPDVARACTAGWPDAAGRVERSMWARVFFVFAGRWPARVVREREARLFRRP